MAEVKKGSGRRPRGSLEPSVILDAAERVARGGVDRLTVRAVAAQLQSAPMALYNHFANMDELVDALLDRALGRLDLPAPTGDWRADFRRLAIAHREFLGTVTWALPAYYRNPFPGPNAARLGEHGLSLLQGAGFDPEAAFVAWSGTIALNYGAASFAAGRAEGGEAAARRNATTLDADEHPASTTSASAVLDYATDEQYATVLDWYLDGLEGQLRRS